LPDYGTITQAGELLVIMILIGTLSCLIMGIGIFVYVDWIFRRRRRNAKRI